MKKWLNSVGYALKGIVLLLRTERNARIETGLAFAVLVLSVWLKLSMYEWCFILICIGAVLAAEAFNSSIERLANFFSQEQHPEIGNIKDISAGGVLILALISACVGILILGPKLVDKLGIL